MSRPHPLRLIAVTLVLALLAAGIPTLPTTSANGATFSVCDAGCDHTTIQAAIDAAGPGDTVVVAPGTYAERLEVAAAKTGLTLCRGEAAPAGCASSQVGSDVHIDARGLGGPALTISAPAATFSGLALTSDHGFAVHLKADDVTLERLVVRVGGPAPIIAIEGDDARKGLVIRGNDIAPVNATTVGEDGIRGRLQDARIEDNHISGFSTGVRLRPFGTDNVVRTNHLDGLNTGIATWSVGTRIEANTFRAVNMGVDVAQDGTTSAAGTILRENEFAGTVTALRLRGDVDVDARLNDWDVAAPRSIDTRIQHAGSDSTVQTLPYLRDGHPEPGLPVAVPAHPALTPAVCDAHPDAESAAGRCRFLTIQAAIDHAAPGGTVYVPAAAALHPAAYSESLTVATNVFGEALDGLTLCGSLGGAICARDIEPGHWQSNEQNRESTAWQTPPSPLSGKALRIDMGVAPGHGSTGWFPAGDLQVEDLTRLAWDQFVESGGCGAGSPRIGIGIDTTGDGARDGTIHVTSSSFTASCVQGTWRHVEFLEQGDIKWNSAAYGGPSAGTQAAAHAAAEAVATANGRSHRVVSVNLIADAGGGTLWFDNQIVNQAFLGERLDESCVATRPAVCREAVAVGHTILDASGAGTLVDVQRDDVAIKGLTIMHAGAPQEAVVGIRLHDVDRPSLVGNRIWLEGGGCSIDSITGGSCYEPYRVTGVLGNSLDARLTDNDISADLASSDGGAIGGTDGIRGSHPGAVIANNTLTGWVGGGMVLGGRDMTIESNNFRIMTTSLLLLNSAHDARVQKNEFLLSQNAISVSSGTPTGMALNHNQLSLSNAVGLQIRDSAGPITADATCNDWGVYEEDAIQATRISEENAPATNLVTVDPFATPGGPDGTGCMDPPRANHTMSDTRVPRHTPVIFSDTSTAGDVPIVHRHWEFGDGAVGYGAEAAHAYSEPGQYMVTLRVRDLLGMTSTATSLLTVTNAAPVITYTGATAVEEGQTLVLDLAATDAEHDVPLSWSIGGAPAGAGFVTTGPTTARLLWTPANGTTGSYPILVTATDALGASTTESITLQVGPSSVTFHVQAIPDLTLVQGSGNRPTQVKAVGHSGTVTLSVSGLPTWATFVDEGDSSGAIHWDPPVGTTGSYTVTVGATDQLATVEHTFVVTVVRWTEVRMTPDEGPFLHVAPGVPVTTMVELRHVRGLDAEVALVAVGPAGWTVATPAKVQVPAGGRLMVPVTITAAEPGRDTQVMLNAQIVGGAAPEQSVRWNVRTPVYVTVDLDEADLAAGVSGSVTARFLGGSPVADRQIEVEQTPGADLFEDGTSRVTGTTDADGRFVFDFGADPRARLPGTHDLVARLSYGERVWFDIERYAIGDL